MTSIKNDVLYFFLVLFNYITDLFIYYNEKIKELVEIYNEDTRGKWVFLTNNPDILPLSAITNLDINNKWIYDSKINKLSYSNSTNKIKIKWLSVELINNITTNSEKTTTEVINLDKYFETLEIYSDISVCPSLTQLLYCICIKHKIWFLSNNTISLVIIDDMGNDIYLDIQNQNIIQSCLKINNNGELVVSLDN